MTSEKLSMPEWLAFLQSQAASVAESGVEVTLAGNRAVLHHALRLSGRTAEADRLSSTGASLNLPTIDVSTLSQAGEALAAFRMEHGPRQDLSLVAILAAEVGEAAILLENEGDPATSAAAAAVVARVERLLDMVNVRIELLLAKIEPFSGRFVDMDAERGRFLVSLEEGWRSDLDQLRRLRVPGSTLTNARLEAMILSQPAVTRLFDQGVLNDAGQLALLRQIERLVEAHDRPAHGGGSTGKPVLGKRTGAGLNNASTQLNLAVKKLRQLSADDAAKVDVHTEALLKILDAAEAQANKTLSMLSPILERYENPASERAVFFAGLLREWTEDVDALRGRRAALAAQSFGEVYLDEAAETEILLARINRNGLISEEGLALRLRQATSLLEHQDQPVIKGVQGRKTIEFDAIVDFWSPQAADMARGAGHYLKDSGHDRPTFLMDPPGRGKRPPEVYDPVGLARDMRWLIRAGRTDEAKAMLGPTLRRLRVIDRGNLAWLAAAAALQDTLTTTELALENLVAANKASGAVDRQIDRLGLIIARGRDHKLPGSLIDRGVEKGDRACAAALLLAIMGRSNKRVALAGGTDSHKGGVFFRLARAHVSDSAPSKYNRILVTDALTGRWLTALPGLAEHGLTELTWGQAEAGRGSAIYRVATQAAASIKASAQACAIPLAPALQGAVLAQALREPLQAFDQAFRSAGAAEASPLIGLGIDRLDDVLALPACRRTEPSFVGVGASAARVARLRLALDGHEPIMITLGQRRRDHVTASYEYFLAGLGNGARGESDPPWTSHLDFDGRWAAQIAAIAACEAVAPLANGPRRAALRWAIQSLATRAIIDAQMAWLRTSSAGEGLRYVV